ncbi:MAG TPA: glycosyltransferase family 4 protein [Actinomycetota bacterium]
MRVLHVVATGERRGAELFASALVGALASEGVEQQVHILRSSGPPSVSFAAPIVAPDGRGPRLPAVRVDLGGIWSLRHTVRAFAPDVVQAHGGEALKHVLASTVGNGARVVYRRIGDAGQFAGSRLRERAHVGLMGRAARVVTVAEALRADLVERLGLPASRVVTIPNGVDPERLEPTRSRTEIRAALGIDADAPVVLSLGALTWEKDPLTHVRVVAEVAADHPGLMHVVAGDGPLRARVEAEVRRLVTEDRTRLLGARRDVGDLLTASDVLLVASRTEGMPACVIEAGMVGVPVVAYGVSGVPEVVVDGATGMLARPGDRAALTNALSGLLAREELRRKLGAAAAHRCRERFGIGVVARRYLDLYEELAKRPARVASDPHGGMAP